MKWITREKVKDLRMGVSATPVKPKSAHTAHYFVAVQNAVARRWKGGRFPHWELLSLSNRSFTATSKATRSATRAPRPHLNLADNGGMLLSTGLWMVIRRVEMSTTRASERWSEASQPSVPTPVPANKPANTCHKNQRESASKAGHQDEPSR